MNPHLWGRGITRRLKLPQVPASVLVLVEQRDGPGCTECNRLGLSPPSDEPLELDHKQPLSLGGDYRWENLQLLCRSHNKGRGNRSLSTIQEPAWLRRENQRALRS